jgi:branched-chain amino acid transport system substrate-binding protein
MKRRDIIAGGLMAGGLGAVLLSGRAPARAQPRKVLTLGVLTDLSGPYGAIAGQGSIACARLAAREFAAAASPDFELAVISADHRNDARLGAAIAAHWYDQLGVDLILDVPNSDVALAVSAVAREKNKAFIDCGAGTGQLTGIACSPNTIHWSYDTTMLARSTGGAFTQAGGSTWFFITADYGFGRQLEDDTTSYVIAAGGRVEGSAAYAFPGTTDFGPCLRQAQQSGAAVLGLANAGTDVTACVRGAHALGLSDDMRIACLLMQLPDVHLLGLEMAGGLLLTESFYWDLNPRSRGFTQRLMKQETPPCYPDMIQAGCYAGALHFLKAFTAMGYANARADLASVIARMKATPTDDDAFGHGSIRRDGRAMFPAFLFQVKTPAESSGPWDYYRLVTTTPAEDAARPVAEDGCPIVKT